MFSSRLICDSIYGFTSTQSLRSSFDWLLRKLVGENLLFGSRNYEREFAIHLNSNGVA